MRCKSRPGVELLEGKVLLSGLAEKLTVARVGGQEVLTFTETNVSNKTVNVTYGPTNSGFTATQNGQAVWISNTGIQPQYLVLDPLKPHESVTLKVSWDGHSNLGGSSKALTGTFKVTNQLDPSGASVMVVLGPVKQVTPPKPPAPKPG